MIDFSPVRSKEKTYGQLAEGYTKPDLMALTDELLVLEKAAIEGITDEDVVFVPVDPAANDTFAANTEEVDLAWTLGHVVVHATASSEEGAARSLTLARGVSVEQRMRYETPWESVTTVQQCIDRLEESHRMCIAMFAAWPDQPHLDTVLIFERLGEVNAITSYILGISHAESHLEQMRETVRQAKAARGR